MAKNKNTDAVARKNAAKARLKNAQTNGTSMQSKKSKRGLHSRNYSEVIEVNIDDKQINGYLTNVGLYQQ